MQTTSFLGHASGIDATLITLVAQLTSAELNLTDNKDDTTCSLVQTVQHAFTNATQEFSAVGMAGCVRLLFKSSQTTLLLGATLAQQAAIESWIESVDQSLLPIVRKGECICS